MIINFIAVDFETATSDRMACQIGITIVENGVVKDTITKLIQPPNNKYDKQCVNVHHITPADTENAPAFDEVWPEIKPLFEDNIVVAHNASFDEDVLHRNLDYYGIQPDNINRFVCTYKIFGQSLDSLCYAFKLSANGHHDAGFDSLCCAKFFLNFIKGIQPDMARLEDYIPEKKRKTNTVFHEPLRGDILKKDLANANPENPFYDKKVVITGIFDIDRKELAEFLKSLGADIDTGITKRTNFVFVGQDAGPSKMVKIQELIEEGYKIRKLCQNDIDKILVGEWQYLIE